ncbi:FAD-binding protein [Shewanella corallii]|uniref:FAD-binding protein n=1 Tax=Shewanella corallii TaxID=560080 RepID=A0ABT0NDB9_9GAMM|nr:FAD-binding protein [Shewanella corallii]MCL2916352.1 FAD-binding protein [Shewanella corallii]
MTKLTNAWVFSDSEARLADIIAGAKALADQVNVFVIGAEDKITKAQILGADKVLYLGDKDSARIVEDYAATMASAIEGNGLVLMANSRRGKALASRLGIKLNAAVFNDASEISIEDGAVRAKHMVYGGLALGEERLLSDIKVVTLTAGVFEPAQAGEAQGEAVNVAFVEPKGQIKCIERRVKEGESVDLSVAKKVIGIGNGISSQENLGIAGKLAELMGAELGCTRPIAETEKWMEKERYIGVTGVMLKPETYLALGVSGQIQHVVGVNTAQTILAVNKDKNAPIFQYADYGLVGDINKVLPALVKALEA